MIFKTSDNVSLFFERKGNGIPCVFIHGGPGGWSMDFELNCGPLLENNFNMIYLDQRGCGRSEGNKDNNYSIDRIVDDIEELRLHLNIDKWIIMAHSFGGIIATDYASKYQVNLESLILINCTLFMDDCDKEEREIGIKLLNLDEVETKKARQESLNDFLTRLVVNDLHYKLQCKEKKTYDYMAELFNQFKNININMALQRESRDDYNKCYYDVSSKINTQTLVIVGDEDYCIGLNHHNNFRFENSHLEIIKGKHVPYLEDTEELVEKINSFIRNKTIVN